MAFIYATDYGVTFDGTTDDYTNLQAAVTAAAGNTLVLPEGTAVISSPLSIPSHTVIRGVYGSTTLKPTSGSTADPVLIDVMTEDYIRFENVCFDGNIASISSGFKDLVKTELSTHVVFDNCRWENVKGLSCYFVDVSYCGVKNSRFKNCGTYNLISSSSADRRQAVAFSSRGDVGKCVDNFARANTFADIGLDCVSIAAGAGSGETGFDVSNNRVRTSYAGAIYISGSHEFTCSENYVAASGGNGIDCANSINGVIKGNICISNNAAGILVADGREIAVVGNVCKNNWAGEASVHKGGITLHATGDEDTVRDITLSGNVCDDSRGNSSTTQLYGVYILGDWDDFDRVKIDNSNCLIGRTAAGAKEESNALFNPNAIAATEFPQIFTLNHLDTKYLLSDHVRGQLMITNITSNYNYISQARPGQAPGQIVDPDSHFASTDTGSGTAVYRGGTTNTVIKNRTGSSKTYMVYVNAVVDTA